LIRLSDRHDRQFSLGATHEETITAIIRDFVKGSKKLPLNLFQIGTKFRDERRPRFGLMRGREFMMKDGYSFHADEVDLEKTFQEYVIAYEKILKKLCLEYKILKADSGNIGGDGSLEFMVLSDIGEDFVVFTNSENYNLEVAPVTDEQREAINNGKIVDEVTLLSGEVAKIRKGIEVGHVFKLGTKYSIAMGATFQNKEGVVTPMQMGCYGLGISRLLSALVELNHDEKGIILPRVISPFLVHILPLANDDQIIEQKLDSLTKLLRSHQMDYLIDDRDERAGTKFADSELIGIPFSVILSPKHNADSYEIKNRINGVTTEIKLDELINIIK